MSREGRIEPIGVFASIAVLLLAGASESPAQQPDTLLAPPDSLVRMDSVLVMSADQAAYSDNPSEASASARSAGKGILAGYEEQLEQRKQMRLAVPDTTLRASDDMGGGVYRLEIDGLVVDETLTKLGRDFYDLFYRGWQAPPDAVNYTITLAEQPVPNLGTRVVVRVNDEIVFNANLQPRYEYIEAVARQALYYTARALTNRQQPPSDIY